MVSILAYYHSDWFVTRKPYGFNLLNRMLVIRGVADGLCYGCEIQCEVRQTMIPLIIKNKHKHYQLQVNVCTYIVPMVNDLYAQMLKGDNFYKCEDMLHLTEEGYRICAEQAAK